MKRITQFMDVAKGWRRDAGKLPMNRGESVNWLTGLITDFSSLVLIRLII